MEKMLQKPKNHGYVEALEMERKKMLVFERELPLSIELVSRAIESFRQNIGGGIERAQQLLSDSSEETASDDCEPLLEFIPIKNGNNLTGALVSPSQRWSESEDQPQDSENFSRKSDWMRSVQLWNDQTTDCPPKEPSMNEPGDAKKRCKSLNEEKSVEKSDGHHSTESSSTETKEELVQYGKKGDNMEAAGIIRSDRRKRRRRWSQELHRRFLHSLQQLGGAHVATPKQIRELMKVDGLTNDEVKSHLQKYRLHTRRPTPPPHNRSNGSGASAPDQLLFVGGIWVSPPDYSTIPLHGGAYSSFPTGGVYTPMAASPAQAHPLLQHFNQKPQIKSSKISEGQSDALARCISPSLSSTTPSHVY